MKNQYLNDKFSNINKEFKKAKEFSESDSKIALMLSSYLVVAISGIFQDCVIHLFIERVNRTSDNEIKNLLDKLIHRDFRNPLYKEINDFLSYLGSNCDEDLRTKIDDKNIQGLNSIVNNKNLVAHGGISNATIRDVKTYYKNALKIFEELEKILL